MPRMLYAMNEPELQAYIAHINNISLIKSDMAASEISMAVDKITAARDTTREPLTVDDSGIGHINIVGVLQQNIDPCALMFGGQTTAYFEIINGAISAENNPDVKNVQFHFDTPGGGIIGLEKAANIIKNMTKPTLAIVHGQCCSAGLFLASQCDTIEAEGELCEVGSLGVKMIATDTTAKDRAAGIVKYTIVSENAPNKDMDISKKTDRLKLKQHITKMENIFIGFVAKGRNATPEFVRKNYGRGAVLIARDAMNIGMIDSIQNEMITSEIITQKTPTQNASGMENPKKTNTQGEKDNMEMSEAQIAKLISDTTESAMSASEKRFDVKLEARDAKLEAEAERKAGFTTLLTKYPKQSAMINEEMKKEDATASVDFAIKVAESETSRIAAAGDQEINANDALDNDTDHQDPNIGAVDNSGNVLAESLGLEIKAEVK